MTAPLARYYQMRPRPTTVAKRQRRPPSTILLPVILSAERWASAADLWKMNHDTKDIAMLMGVRESTIYNGLHRYRERARQGSEA